MLREDQIDLRRQRARTTKLVIENRTPKKKVFSTYKVTNPDSGGEYDVTVRGFEVGESVCTCPDFKSNTLGTCKHILAVLDELKDHLPAQLQKKKAAVVRPEIVLDYGETLRLVLHLPPRHSDKLGLFAKRYFDDAGNWSGKGRYEELVGDGERVPDEIWMPTDALDFVDREVERAEMARKEAEWLARLDAGTLDLNLLTVPLYDYQTRGALFLACRGRSILGDDMGLGKTIQTLAAIELLARERGIGRVLVVAPASVKYQWESEIKKFTGRATQVIDGSPEERKEQYTTVTFYRLVNYEQVVRDRAAINAWKPDVIVLDEAQRIKNWASKTAKEVKRLISRYAIVLSGTPLENKLEELFSIVQFVDERRFGPAFQFLNDHRVLDDKGNIVGYRNLDTIRERLEPIFLRRTRGEVLTQLPARTDTTIYVELSDEQRTPYEEQRTTLARLLQKGFLSEIDRKRVLASLANMRLLCDSTFLFDKTTNVSPKLVEFAELIRDLVPLTPGGQATPHKLVVFSQWETMLNLAAEVLDRLGVGYALLHGGMPGKDRKAVMATFNTDPDCKVFLSTDAGGTGLNLQVADTVVNLELPWNPAVLEQRIARVHRMGQSRPVRVVNFITRGTVEESVLRTLEQKKLLFAGVFEGDEDEIAFSAIQTGGFLDAVREIIGEPKAEAQQPVFAPVSVGTVSVNSLPRKTLETEAELVQISVRMLESVTAFLVQPTVWTALGDESRIRIVAALNLLTQSLDSSPGDAS